MVKVKDVAYPQDVAFQFRHDELPGSGIRRIIRTGDLLWVISNGKAVVLSVGSERAEILSSADPPSPINNARPDGDGLMLAADDGIWRAELRGGEIAFEKAADSEEPLIDLDRRGDEWVCLASSYIARAVVGRVEPIAELPPFKTGRVLLAHPETGEIWVGADRGMGKLSVEGWEWHTYAGSGLPRNEVRDLKVDGMGFIWVATGEGPTVFNGRDWWYPFGPEVKLPYENIFCIEFGPKGEVWLGTDKGVLKLIDGSWKVYSGRRWLPGDRVFGIAPDPEGGAWVMTDGGLAHLYSKPMTLREKADHIERIRAARHNREGWVSHCELKGPGNLEEFVHEASDNDGLWTGIYLAAESFRWAVTKEEEAKRYVKQSLRALAFLEEVTPIPGFVARSARRVGDERSRKSGGEWHLSDDGKWEWKGDTSSDEIDGHFFGYAVCYELAADEEDKKLIREKVARIMDHIIEHDFVLQDVDGERTQWSVWRPSLLNRDEWWRWNRGLNSLEILSHLKVAYRITGDERYERIYRHLALEEGYALNLIEQYIADPRFNVYHDNQLAFLAYYPLLLFEDDPELRKFYLLSLERTWRYVRKDRCPLWNFIYGALTGKPCDVEEAVKTLREIPLDMVRWSVDNTFRRDLIPNPYRPGESLEPVPPGERDVVNWDGNPYKLRGGAGGMTENDGAFFLLPYWMGRYHGFIEG